MTACPRLFTHTNKELHAPQQFYKLFTLLLPSLMLEMGASLKLFCTFSVSKQTFNMFCSLLFPLLIFVFFVCKLKNEQIKKKYAFF